MWEAECALLKTLVPKGESVQIPVEDFEPVTTAVAEDIEGAFQRIGPTQAHNEMSKTIESFAHIRR